jgi:hypothetical protein
MFESLVVIDPDADEAASIARITELETLKAGAAVAGWPPRSPWPGGIPRTAVTATSGSPTPWSTK